MSRASHEPEKYSIDEMMERLKSKPQDSEPVEGELVTRADGSQAIRVRKRKRRSRQPHKEQEQRAKRLRTIRLTVGLAGALAVAVAAAVLIVYANSSPYREGVIAKTTAATGAQVGLRQFRVSPVAANAAAAKFEWPAGSPLDSLEMQSVEASIHPSSFFGKSWTGEELRSRQAHLVLRRPVAGEAVAFQPEEPASGTVDFDRVTSPRFRLTMGDPSQPALDLRDAEATFYPTGGSGLPQFQVARGELTIPGWPKFRLDRAFMEFRGPEVDISRVMLLAPDDSKGTLLLSGVVAPMVSDRPSTLAVKAENFPFAALAGKETGALVAGRIDTREAANSNFLTVPPAGEAAAMQLAFRPSLNDSLVLGNFPFLTVLSKLLNDKWFEFPEFDSNAAGTLRRQGQAVRIGDLALVSKGRMAVGGEIHVAPDLTLGGTLEVGLADAVVAAAEDPRLAEVFWRSEEGFRWASITLSGTAAMPADDFLKVLDGAAPDAAAAPRRDAGIPTFEDLTRER